MGHACALRNLFYALTRETYSPRLAWTTFGLLTTGVLIMIPTLAMLLKTGDTATWGPLTGPAGGLAILGMLTFAISVFGELVRKRS